VKGETVATTTATSSRRDLAIAAVALVAVAINLRTTVSSLPPLLGEIRRDVPLSGPAAGVLTALPVLCMAWLAPSAARLNTRLGPATTALASLVLIGIGNALRGTGSNAAALMAATFVAGAGVAVLGIVIPAVVKSAFDGHQGAATGAYSVAMMGGSVIAATLAVPLADALGSWRASLASWALPAVAGAAVWAVAAPAYRRRAPDQRPTPRPHSLPWRSRPAWLLAAFMTAQSSLAYAYIAWLAPSYVERGWTPLAAGSLLGLTTLAQVVASLALPAMSDTVVEFRRLCTLTVTLTVVGTAWLWLLPETVPALGVVILGLGTGAGFSLGLTRVVHYAADAQASSALMAMVFLVSYTVAATVPVLIGAVRDATGGFTVPFGFLVVVAVVQLALARTLDGRYRGVVT
jgi:MFS transporter, CP family, cyanate transporter